MKKQAKDLKVGEIIEMAGETMEIKSVELSELGKQGQQKCRLVALRKNGEKAIIIRPSDYPFEVK